jgi:hypothetical protein
MSKATTKSRIQTEITTALANNSITPTIVGSILDEILELDTRPYKVYTALLSQVGTNPPTAIVLENTLSGSIVWTRNHIGQYLATLIGGFVVGKTTATINNTSSTQLLFFDFDEGLTTDNVLLNRLTSGISADGLVNNTIEIRVYN